MDIQVEVLRKEIKNIHLSVYPPDGRVRIAVPNHVTDDRVRLAVIAKLAWIRKQQANFKNQARQSVREMVTGESHYFMGQRYLLEVIERAGKHRIEIKGNRKICIFVNPNTTRENRQLVLDEWYRMQLKQRIADLLGSWQEKIGVQCQGWAVRRMKRKWGSCNIQSQTILFNLELAKTPNECLEYIIVHELVHLLERHHNHRFIANMDRFLPNWRVSKAMLNNSPLVSES